MFEAIKDTIMGFEEIMSDCATALIGKQSEEEPHTKEALINKKIKAIEQIEAEKDPVIKRRMQIYFNEGIWDFSNIRNI